MRLAASVPRPSDCPRPLISRQLGSLVGVAVVRLSIVPFYLALIMTPNLPLAAVTRIVRQTSISMAWPIDSTFIAEVLPPRARTRVYGLRAAAWNLGFSAASLVAGVLIVNVGYQVTFFDLDPLHHAGDDHLRRLLQPASARALGRAQQCLPRWRRRRPPLVDAFAEEAP